MTGVDSPYIAERDDVGAGASKLTEIGGEQEADVVAEIGSAEDRAGEPGRGVVENGQPVWTLTPPAVRELVRVVAGVAAEQGGERQMCPTEEMHSEVIGRGGDPEGAVLSDRATRNRGGSIPTWVANPTRHPLRSFPARVVTRNIGPSSWSTMAEKSLAPPVASDTSASYAASGCDSCRDPRWLPDVAGGYSSRHDSRSRFGSQR